MDGERSDGELEVVVDEFACAGMLRGSLTSLHGTVERIFCVAFAIGADDLSHGNNGQIWLKLQGRSDGVKAAKVSHRLLVGPDREPVRKTWLGEVVPPIVLLLSTPPVLV